MFKYTERSALSLDEHQREVRIPFSYVNGTALEVQTHEDPIHPLDVGIWSQPDDPGAPPHDPVLRYERQPQIRSIVRLKLGSGAERSAVLIQAKLQANEGDRITLIFPVPVARALNALDDHAAIAAVDYTTRSHAWNTGHPEIQQVEGQLPRPEAKRFDRALASYLDGLCMRCLRLFDHH